MNITDFNGTNIDENLVVIRVSGDDASSFLQGQFSNNVELVSNEKYQYSTFSTNQGKVIGTFRLFSHEQSFLILINTDVVDVFIDRLKKYIIMSKVVVEKIEINCLASFGEEAKQYLDADKFERESNILVKDNNILLNCSTSFYHSCFILSLNKDIPISKDYCISSKIKVGEFIDIINVFPRLHSNVQDTYIPQVLNMESHDAINYKKGCYTGQEIVARTHYLGKIKKILLLCSIDNLENFVGNKIHNKNSEIVGEVITLRPITIERVFFNAVIKLNSVEEELFLNKSSLKVHCFTANP